MIVLVPEGSTPVVMDTGSWATQADCKSARETAFMPSNKQQGQLPSISFVCVPEAAEALPDTK
jgi:hypothetical protein